MSNPNEFEKQIKEREIQYYLPVDSTPNWQMIYDGLEAADAVEDLINEMDLKINHL